MHKWCFQKLQSKQGLKVDSSVNSNALLQKVSWASLVYLEPNFAELFEVVLLVAWRGKATGDTAIK